MSGSITHAAWFNAPETRAVIGALDAVRPGGARFVGGCVRNTILNQPVDDIDIATQILPDDVVALAKASGFAAAPTGIEHGTVTVICNHKPFEVTTLRRDVSTDGRRATVAFTESWDEDAQRRDFRLNALYADASGALHDPTGGGLDDARHGRVIFIGDAHQRIREDYLRIMRFFRFHAWYGKGEMDSEGLKACADLREGLTTLSAERVWKESKKLLWAYDPRAVLDAMEASGVRAIVWPESTHVARLERLIAIQSELFVEADAMTRVASFLASQDDARALSRRLKVSNDERARLVAALGDEEKITSFMSMRETRRALYKLGRQAFEDRVLIAWADDPKDKTAPQWRALLALAESWTPPAFPLTGDQVMAAGVPMGPLIGKVLKEVETWWIDADFPDDPLALAERLKAVAQALS
ncbi:MAG: CCA tRNA nucleotidyltransferase [Caulobacterales bacterium]